MTKNLKKSSRKIFNWKRKRSSDVVNKSLKIQIVRSVACMIRHVPAAYKKQMIPIKLILKHLKLRRAQKN